MTPPGEARVADGGGGASPRGGSRTAGQQFRGGASTRPVDWRRAWRPVAGLMRRLLVVGGAGAGLAPSWRREADLFVVLREGWLAGSTQHRCDVLVSLLAVAGRASPALSRWRGPACMDLTMGVAAQGPNVLIGSGFSTALMQGFRHKLVQIDGVPHGSWQDRCA
jgi:hypothetical protein